VDTGYLVGIVMLVFFPGVRKFDDDSDGRWGGHDFPAQAQPESNTYTVTGCAIKTLKCPHPSATPMTRIIHWNYGNL
jgi:hypothetical protein